MKSLYETKYVFTLPHQKSAFKSICEKYFLPFQAKTAKRQIFKNGPNQLIFWAWHKIWKVYMKLNMFLPYHTKNQLSNPFAQSTFLFQLYSKLLTLVTEQWCKFEFHNCIFQSSKQNIQISTIYQFYHVIFIGSTWTVRAAELHTGSLNQLSGNARFLHKLIQLIYIRTINLTI